MQEHGCEVLANDGGEHKNTGEKKRERAEDQLGQNVKNKTEKKTLKHVPT